ncbi:hypothetical protein GCM10022239_19190 [Leifsonia bigeumensis]|uniref:Chemotaxis protein n=1 Tax=Leifsonella bigeumensis TaxID=433643 RepID=A0ABP7FMV3_9MICO
MSAIQSTASGRRCTVCSHPQRSQIEAALIATSRNLAQVSRDHAVSEDALRRHWNTHTAPGVRQAMEQSTDGLSALTIAARMVDLVHAAGDIRRRSIEAGKDSQALRAIEVERATLASVADRLGIPSTAALDEVTMMQSIAVVMAQLARTDPETGERIAAQFQVTGRPDIAADLRTLLQESREALTA